MNAKQNFRLLQDMDANRRPASADFCGRAPAALRKASLASLAFCVFQIQE
jgi:hypothetical protein